MKEKKRICFQGHGCITFVLLAVMALRCEALKVIVLDKQDAVKSLFPLSQYSGLKPDDLVDLLPDYHYRLRIGQDEMWALMPQTGYFAKDSELVFVLETSQTRLVFPREQWQRLLQLLRNGWQAVMNCPLMQGESSPCASFMMHFLRDGLTDFQHSPLINGYPLFWQDIQLDKKTTRESFEREIKHSLVPGDTLRIAYTQYGVKKHYRSYLCLGNDIFLGWNPMIEGFHIFHLSHIYRSLRLYFSFAHEAKAMKIISSIKRNEAEELSGDAMAFLSCLFRYTAACGETQRVTSGARPYIIDPGAPESPVNGVGFLPDYYSDMTLKEMDLAIRAVRWLEHPSYIN